MKARFVVLFLAALVAFGSLPIMYVNHLAAENKLKALEDQCEAEAKARNTKPDCKKYALTIGPWLTDTQRQIYYSNTDSGWLNNWTGLFFFCAIIAAIPFAWRFFLARLREIARALRGLD